MYLKEIPKTIMTLCVVGFLLSLMILGDAVGKLILNYDLSMTLFQCFVGGLLAGICIVIFRSKWNEL